MTDERLDWFPCNPAKLLGALASMKAPEGYVYVIVLLRIYECGGPCRDTIDALATRSRLNRRVVTECLNSLFKAGRLVSRDGGIHNPVAEAVIADSLALREKRKSAGSAGGNRSAEKRKEKQQTKATKTGDLPQQTSTLLQLQDSLFPNGNSAQRQKPSKPPTELEIARKELFDRGKQVLGSEAGGFVQKLLAAKHGNIALARAAIEQASTMDNPRQYIGGILRGGTNEANRAGASKRTFAVLAAELRYGAGGVAGADAVGPEPDDRYRNPA